MIYKIKCEEAPFALMAAFFVFNIKYPRVLAPFYTFLEHLILNYKIAKPTIKLSSFLVSFSK